MELEFVGGRLETRGGRLLELAGKLHRGTVDRDHAQRDRARAAGALAVRHLVGVALDDGDLVVVEAEMAGDELGVGGGVALAVGLGADQQRRGAVVVEGDGGALGARKGAGLDVGREADAADLAGLSRRRGARREAVVIGKLQRAGQVAVELAAIVVAVALGLVREVGRRDEIAPPDFDRAEAGLAAAGIDQPLDEIGGLGTPGAAVGIDRHRVGVDAAQIRVEHRNVVDAGRHGQPADRNVRPVLVLVGAHVGQQVDAQRQETAVGVHGHLGDREVVAPVGVDEMVLGAIGDPLDRLAETLGGERRQRILVVARTPWCRSRRRRPA